MKKYIFLILLTAFTSLNAALATDHLIWKERQKNGYEQQKKASVVFAAKILDIKQVKDSNSRPPLVKVFIRIEPVKTYRKPSTLRLPRVMTFSYVKVDYSTGWVGPASYSKNTPTIPKKKWFYTFYLNDKLEFSADEYSIELNKYIHETSKKNKY